MANFWDPFDGADQEEREEAMEEIIASKTPAEAAQEIVDTIFTPLVHNLNGACPWDCDSCR